MGEGEKRAGKRGRRGEELSDLVSCTYGTGSSPRTNDTVPSACWLRGGGRGGEEDEEGGKVELRT